MNRQLEEMTKRLLITEKERQSLRNIAKKIDLDKVPKKFNVPREYIIGKKGT